MRYASRAARRYARAVWSLADEAGRLEELVGQLTAADQTLQRFTDLRQALTHRQIPEARKLSLLRQAFGPSEAPAGGDAEPAPPRDVPELSELSLHFLELLVRHQRLDLLGEVVVTLQQMLDERQGLVRATVTTAVPLLRAERDAIEAKLRELTGAQRIALETKVSRRILGGVIIHVGSQVIDASVRTYLDTMRERLRRVRVAQFEEHGYLQLDFGRLRAAARDALGGPGEA